MKTGASSAPSAPPPVSKISTAPGHLSPWKQPAPGLENFNRPLCSGFCACVSPRGCDAPRVETLRQRDATPRPLYRGRMDGTRSRSSPRPLESTSTRHAIPAPTYRLRPRQRTRGRHSSARARAHAMPAYRLPVALPARSRRSLTFRAFNLKNFSGSFLFVATWRAGGYPPPPSRVLWAWRYPIGVPSRARRSRAISDFWALGLLRISESPKPPGNPPKRKKHGAIQNLVSRFGATLNYSASIAAFFPYSENFKAILRI